MVSNVCSTDAKAILYQVVDRRVPQIGEFLHMHYGSKYRIPFFVPSARMQVLQYLDVLWLFTNVLDA
jgi:hypothetical protein